ncbi:hypothetical protein [Saccharothrix longispora]|uniref:hypothetical protein n=1 Tax=Saccharothrix longispora TaxID=33920 RepID=UPI0028FD2496|nr:hypothetical protein [Saccharothrix longispora]MDU0289454.1 hypothetical protein [Saccharothrix longispora]
MRWVVVLLALLGAGCAAPAFSAEQVRLTIGGQPVVDASSLQARAEAELSYTLSFGYVARTSDDAVSCWFARTGRAFDVDTRLWCGPVQVPGTAAATDWVPVPLEEVGRDASGVRLEVGPPQVPAQGARSTPVGTLVRTDGRETTADQGVGEAGPDFLAVLPDEGQDVDEASAVVRDDQLEVRVTGYASPPSWSTAEGELRAEHGVALRVLRLRVVKHGEVDSAFLQTPWRGWLPQPPELALDLPGRRHPLPADRLPKDGAVLVVYTVPAGGGSEALVLNTVGAKSLEQRVEVPSGKAVGAVAGVLRRSAGPESTSASTPVALGSANGSVEVVRARLGRQRPVSSGDQYELATAAPGKALLELRLQGRDLPTVLGAPITVDLVVVTLPDGTRAPPVGARHGGEAFPVAVVVEVPEDVRSVTFSVTAGTVVLPRLGSVAVSGGEPATVDLDF